MSETSFFWSFAGGAVLYAAGSLFFYLVIAPHLASKEDRWTYEGVQTWTFLWPILLVLAPPVVLLILACQWVGRKSESIFGDTYRKRVEALYQERLARAAAEEDKEEEKEEEEEKKLDGNYRIAPEREHCHACGQMRVGVETLEEEYEEVRHVARANR